MTTRQVLGLAVLLSAASLAGGCERAEEGTFVGTTELDTKTDEPLSAYEILVWNRADITIPIRIATGISRIAANRVTIYKMDRPTFADFAITTVGPNGERPCTVSRSLDGGHGYSILWDTNTEVWDFFE